MRSTIQNKPHYLSLDLMRGIAILMVVLYHNFSFWSFTAYGWLGVDLFFVLSGFLITSILWDATKQQGGISAFYIRRAMRVFPLYYLALALTVFVIPPFTQTPYDVGYYQKYLPWFALFAQNWLFILVHPEKHTFLNHFWSVAVEEQFYLLWPLAIICLRSARKLLLFLLVLFSAFSVLRFWLAFAQPYDILYHNLFSFSRIDGIIAGSIVGILMKENNSRINKNYAALAFVIAAIAAAMLLLQSVQSAPMPFEQILLYPLFAVLFGAAVFFCVRKNHLFKQNTIAKVLSFFARISYGLYIIHWPVYLWLNPVLHIWLSKHLPAGAANLLNALAVTALAIVLSVASYRYFEKPFLKLKSSRTPLRPAFK